MLLEIKPHLTQKILDASFLIILIRDNIGIDMFLLIYRLEGEIYFYLMMKQSNLVLSGQKHLTEF